MSKNYKCMLCKSKDNTLVQVGVRHSPAIEVRRCMNCGLVFLWPCPEEKELNRYYKELYRDDYAEPPIQERYLTDLDEARIRVRRLLSLLKKDTRLLEVGCGSGAFLDAVRPYVAEVLGVEPDVATRKWVQRQIGISVKEQVGDITNSEKNFDLVALFHTLEHIPDPVFFLKKIIQLLKPEGKMIIEVPNIDDVLITVYHLPTYQQFYYQKAHLYYFSKDTLTIVLNQAGFDATIKGIQRYDLSNHICWMLTGKPGGQGYYNSILLPSLDAAYADSLIRSWHSDTLWAVSWAKRNSRGK